MTTAQLKSQLLQRIENLDDERKLKLLKGVLDSLEQPQIGQIWESLTEQQRQEALLSYEESFDENKLLDWEEVYKRKR